MKKKDFVRKFASKGYTIKDSTVIVDDFLYTLEEILTEGESVDFHGFGEFGVIERKERNSPCVKTGEMILIPAFKSPKFTPGASLKRAVREGIIRR